MTDLDYLRRACEYARDCSDDPNTQCGAVLVGVMGGGRAMGANRIPPLVPTPDLHHRKTKLRYIEHAEREAIFAAAVLGLRTEGSTLYAPWFCCCECARAIILAGVKEVVGLASLDAMTPRRWREEVDAGQKMLADAGVSLRWIANLVGVTILFDGKEVEV